MKSEFNRNEKLKDLAASDYEQRLERDEEKLWNENDKDCLALFPGRILSQFNALISKILLCQVEVETDPSEKVKEVLEEMPLGSFLYFMLNEKRPPIKDVVVLTEGSLRIGEFHESGNEIVFRFLNSGKLLIGTLEKIDTECDPMKIFINVYYLSF